MCRLVESFVARMATGKLVKATAVLESNTQRLLLSIAQAELEFRIAEVKPLPSGFEGLASCLARSRKDQISRTCAQTLQALRPLDAAMLKILYSLDYLLPRVENWQQATTDPALARAVKALLRANKARGLTYKALASMVRNQRRALQALMLETPEPGTEATRSGVTLSSFKKLLEVDLSLSATYLKFAEDQISRAKERSAERKRLPSRTHIHRYYRCEPPLKEAFAQADVCVVRFIQLAEIAAQSRFSAREYEFLAADIARLAELAGKALDVMEEVCVLRAGLDTELDAQLQNLVGLI